MLRSLFIVFMILFSGCAGISPKAEKLGNSLETLMEQDFKIVRLAALYHARHSQWPENVEELNNFKTDDEAPAARLLLSSVEQVSTIEEHWIVEIRSFDPDSAQIVKRQIRVTPLDQAGKYEAKYMAKGDERGKMNSTMEINVREEL